MSISFSGLGSGIDTSSWITSLTALKQAKVTTLQNQKNEIVTAKDSLSTIKTIFSEFRSKIEKITDGGRFQSATLDVFSKKIATSANLNVVSASATADAIEGTYEVKVDKIATKTQATSAYKYRNEIEHNEIATKENLLKHLGISTGTISVTVRGETQEFDVDAAETVDDMISRMKSQLGIDAVYLESAGILCLSDGVSAI